MNKKVRILHLEDSDKDSELIHSMIESSEIANEYFLTDNKKDYLDFLEKENIDLILSDYNLPDYNGNEALKIAREKYATIPFIFVSGTMGEDVAINAMLNGATDYVLKNRLERLVPAIKRALHEFELESSRKQAEKNLIEKNELIEAQNVRYVQINKELAFQIEEKEKQALELIQAREKAEESDALKSAFLHNLSHEIRTPMNQILGFANFLKEPGLSESDRDDYIGIINSQSHQLLHIITDIVEISKITTGQVDLKLCTFNLAEMMDELLILNKTKAEHRNLKLSLSKKITDEDSIIQGDQIKLKEVFSHLIENAIKFTDEGSIDIEYKRAGDRLIITVKDTGIGINAQEKQAIFDQFRQVEISMARKYGGMGLGLSISNAYIRMMSGIIRVESVPGKGSAFFVEIPYIPAIQAAASPMIVLHLPVISRPDWHDKTLLIAEDEESNVQFLMAVLRSTGIRLLFAVNGLEAVEQCRSHPEIAVVLMDIKMPRMDGLEATKIIKSFCNELPVIATTAFAMASEKEYILQAGCDDYLPKPIKREDLIAKIQKYIGGKSSPTSMIEKSPGLFPSQPGSTLSS